MAQDGFDCCEATLSTRQTIRLLADYGVEWPLWDERGPVDDPLSLGLSEPLCERIRRWFAATGEAAIEDPPPGEDMSEEEIETEALGLVDAIQQELGEGYHVELTRDPPAAAAARGDRPHAGPVYRSR
jgi:hypothetical protein